MNRNYTVSQDPASKLWYCHMIGFSHIPVFGSFGTKSHATEYAKMMDGLPHRVKETKQDDKSTD